MKNLSRLAFYTVIIRAITLILRLSLIIILAKFYTTDFVGIYGLIAGLVGIAVQLLPFGFIHYSTLEILEKNSISTNKILANHFFFILIMGCFFAPIFYASYGYMNISFNLFFYIVFVLIFEILALELSRILIALKNPIGCYIVALIHSSLWIFGIIISLVKGVLVSMEELLILWGSSSFLASIIGFYFIKQDIFDKIFNLNLISIQWIKKGIFFSYPLLIASLSHAINQYIGRFFLNNNVPVSDIGIFTIYFQISALILIAVEVLQSVYLPTYVEKYSSNKKNTFFELIMFFLICFIMLSIVFIEKYLFTFMNPELLNNLETMHMLLLAISALSFASVLRNRLYVKRLQYKIMYSYLIAMIISLVGNLLLVPKYGIYGSASTMFISAIALCLSIYLFDKFNKVKIV
tara:strand:+ start:4864 stop:6084 length:1221 start_codon:yes stop_codon:yes gene_type:complete